MRYSHEHILLFCLGVLYCWRMKGCIFDFDGVICDSEKYHYLAWEQTAKVVGVSFTREEYVPFQSTGRKKVIAYLCEKAGLSVTDELFDRLSAVKSETFARLTDKVGADDLIKGVDTFIRKLHESGYVLAMASSASSAKRMLTKLGLSPYFAVLLDGNDVAEKKPDPTIFLTAAEKLGLTPAECTVFEDSPAGVLAAKTGGFSVVGMGTTLPTETDYPRFNDFTEAYPFFFKV